MGLFGIFAHGMPGFKMEKTLIALVACESERHTAVNIDTWTEEALKDIGLTVDGLLGTDTDTSASVSAINLLHLKPDDLTRIGVSEDSTDPDDFVFKKVSDNGANIKLAWDEDGKWAPCFDHTVELCTIPFTFVTKNKKGEEARIEKGSVSESYSKARGLVGYLHHSTIGEADFHACQKRVGLAEDKIDQDVRTRWRSSHDMGDQIVYNMSAVLEMDKNPAYKDPGETWGKNKLSFTDWDHLEEGSACLMEAAVGSQLLEGDLYPTSSLVVPTAFRLMSYSVRPLPAEPECRDLAFSPALSDLKVFRSLLCGQATSHDVYFRNRDEDEYNDSTANPVCVKHTDLQPKIQQARELYHERLVTRFDSDVPLPIKKFWFIAAMLDPRFKKLTFDGDDMLKPAMRREATRWLTEEYNANYKNKVYNPSAAQGSGGTPAAGAPAPDAGARTGDAGKHVKRRKVSSASFFSPRVAGAAAAPTPTMEKTDEDGDMPFADEYVHRHLSIPTAPPPCRPAALLPHLLPFSARSHGHGLHPLAWTGWQSISTCPSSAAPSAAGSGRASSGGSAMPISSPTSQ